MERQAIQFALLEWINYFPLPSRVQTARDLNDGILLWELLCQIDPKYFGVRHLQSPLIKNPEDWLLKWNNVKQIYRELVSYIRDECESNLSLGESAVPDAKAIADWTGEATWELTKLLKIIVIAAIRSPKANEFLGQIATSPEQMQAVMKSIIEDLTAEDDVASDATSPTVDSQINRNQVFNQGSGVGELAFEEQLAKIQSEKKELFLDKQDLQQEVSELHDRLVRLQDNNQVLQSNLTAAEDRLGTHGAAGKGYGRGADTVIHRLETRLHEAEDVIAEYEVRQEEGKASKQEQEKLIESLQPASRLAIKLQDDLDEIKIERNNLAKKANALDKYKQKLQASQSLETENRELRLQLEETQKQLTASEDDRDKILGLEMTIDKYQQMIRHIEQDNHELQVTKEQYAIDKQTLVQRLERKAEQEVRYEAQIADLQLDRSGQQLGAVGRQGDDGDLEAELNDTAVTKTDLQLQISTLKAELRQAKSGGVLGARIIMLDTLLKEAKKKVEALEHKWLDASQREKAIEAQLAVLRRGPILEGHELLFKLRENNSSLEVELAVLAKRLQSTEFELSSKRRELSAAKTDLSLIDKSEAEALAALKAANSAEVDGLRVANSQLLGHYEQISLELDMQKSLLNKALIQLNTHRDHLDESQSTEFKKTLDILKAATRDAGHDGTDYEAMKRRITQQEEEIESGNRLLSEQLKATEAHVARLREVESELSLAKESERTAILKAQQEQLDQQKSSQAVELENLSRENALMATAWYELSSRMQQNNVDLQRRTEPRSWLNKQRGLLNSTTTSSGAGTAR